MIIVGDDALRTQYVPPEPTVKILRRPINGTVDGFISNGNDNGKPKQPLKTLRQREQEYAEARLRILGEAKSPEEDEDSSEITISGSSNSTSLNGINGTTVPTCLLRPSELVCIIRSPRGPDGTNGFKVRR